MKSKKSNQKKQVTMVTTSKAPIAIGTTLTKVVAKPPSVQFAPDGGCRIKHREYMCDLSSAIGPPTTEAFAINPQRAQVFTWLSALATRFEMYKFNTLKFTYKPSCSTTTPGWVALGFDFDYYDDAPVKSTILAWRYSAKTTPWNTVTLDVSSDSRLATYRYNNYEATRGDARLDFLGNLWVLTDTNPFASNIGELFVDYDVTFRQPAYKIPPALYSEFIGDQQVSPTTVSFTKLVKQFGNLLTEVVGNDTIRIKDVGSFLVTASTILTGSTLATTPTITTSAGAASASWEDSPVETITNVAANQGLVQREIVVKTAPVDVHFNSSSAGAPGTSLLRATIATFGEEYAKLTL